MPRVVEFIEKNIELWLTEIVGQESWKLDFNGCRISVLFFHQKVIEMYDGDG